MKFGVAAHKGANLSLKPHLDAALFMTKPRTHNQQKHTGSLMVRDAGMQPHGMYHTYQLGSEAQAAGRYRSTCC